jgi:hypothetical protein
MTRKQLAEAAAVLTLLSAGPGARLVAAAGGFRAEGGPSAGKPGRCTDPTARWLLSRGLLAKAPDGALVLTSAAAAWLKRRTSADQPFRIQHGEVTAAELGDHPTGPPPLIDHAESPVALLARPARGSGKAWLARHMVTAAERLRRDFEIARLQPRVTANWSASVNQGKRSGSAGSAELTDMALAARLRVDRALRAVGPELADVLIDICCFLKGLETVERERQWPARSAKLVLRLALSSLARHYGLGEAATGAPAGAVRHWGAEDYRPEIT